MAEFKFQKSKNLIPILHLHFTHKQDEKYRDNKEFGSGKNTLRNIFLGSKN